MTSTLLEIMLESAKRCGAAFDATCSDDGTLTTLVDETAMDQGTDAGFASGGWIYRPDAALAADKVRRINDAGFDPTTGTWTVGRAWTNAPANAEAYQIYAILPPIEQTGIAESWRRLVNRAFDNIWYTDEITVGFGDGSFQRRFLIVDEDGWTPNEQHILGVVFRFTDDNGIVFDIDQSKNGQSWRVDISSSGNQLRLIAGPPSGQAVVVKALRTYPHLTDDTDETVCPLDVATLRTRFELYSHLNANPQSQGQYQGERDLALRDWLAEYRHHRPGGALVIV